MPSHERFEYGVRFAWTGDKARVRRDAHGNESGRGCPLFFRQAPQRFRHEIYPHRQSGTATLLSRPERAFLIESDPGCGDEPRIETAEPGIPAIVRGAGLARKIRAS